MLSLLIISAASENQETLVVLEFPCTNGVLARVPIDVK